MSCAVLVVEHDGVIKSSNAAGMALFDRPEEDIVGRPWNEIVELPSAGSRETKSVQALLVHAENARFLRPDGSARLVLLTGRKAVSDESTDMSVVCVAMDITETQRLEGDLRHAMESVGQLASGIAHEINTPVQFVGDSIDFLHDAYSDYSGLRNLHRKLREAGDDQDLASKLVNEISNYEEEVEIDFLEEEVPAAFERAMGGLKRVARIVGALKEFAHPSGSEKAPSDLNHAIENTLIVSKNEYKYVATVKTFLGELPKVVCCSDDVSRVFLNLIVNAAHAIEDRYKGTGALGLITIRTRATRESVIIEIQDDGAGIPESAQRQVFDPFFTTKEVGRGSGQGLAIAYSIIVDKHGGRIGFETELGLGTCFRIELPLEERRAAV